MSSTETRQDLPLFILYFFLIFHLVIVCNTLVFYPQPHSDARVYRDAFERNWNWYCNLSSIYVALFLPIFFFMSVHECKRNNNYTHNEHYTHLLTQAPYKDEEMREKNKTLSQRGNKNKKMNLKVDLIPPGNSKETDTGGI